MPFPMNPTQLTVFTRASASALRMLPCVSSTIDKGFLAFGVAHNAVRFQLEQHRGELTEIERDVVAHGAARAAGDGPGAADVLNVNVADSAIGQAVVRSVVGRMEASTRQKRAQIIHADDPQDWGWIGLWHPGPYAVSSWGAKVFVWIMR